MKTTLKIKIEKGIYRHHFWVAVYLQLPVQIAGVSCNQHMTGQTNHQWPLHWWVYPLIFVTFADQTRKDDVPYQCYLNFGTKAFCIPLHWSSGVLGGLLGTLRFTCEGQFSSTTAVHLGFSVNIRSCYQSINQSIGQMFSVWHTLRCHVQVQMRFTGRGNYNDITFKIFLGLLSGSSQGLLHILKSILRFGSKGFILQRAKTMWLSEGKMNLQVRILLILAAMNWNTTAKSRLHCVRVPEHTVSISIESEQTHWLGPPIPQDVSNKPQWGQEMKHLPPTQSTRRQADMQTTCNHQAVTRYDDPVSIHNAAYSTYTVVSNKRAIS